MQIGITDTFKEDKYELYVHWIRSVDGEVEILKLSHELNNVSSITMLNGLILTGGGDVHPRFYEKEYQLAKAKGVNEKRDEFEFTVIEQTLDAGIPILGICRGMQVMNVCLGGSLVTDLVSDGFNDHTSLSDVDVKKHKISVVPYTLLHTLTVTSETEVNSLHHQSVDRLGKGLIYSAVSADNVVEAAEWAIKDNMPFLMLVQWHPERSTENFLSQKLARLFMREVQHYISNKMN
jgi:putative glutamine amidotransferase